jgi:hypothetical protein
MNTKNNHPTEAADQRGYGKVDKLLLTWFALVAVVLIGMSVIPGPQPSAAVAQPTPAPRYAYCSKAWRAQQLPPDMQAIFEDWCEHRPGAINAGALH